jgi:enterobactin synthetase component D
VTFARLFERHVRHGIVVAVALPAREIPIDEATLSRLHPGERAHAMTLAPRRRVSWVGGRIALRHALVAAGLEADAVLVTTRGAPALPPWVRGSVSHKDTIAVALIASAVDDNAAPWAIGIDVEVDIPRTIDVSRHVLVDAERARLAHLPDDERLRVVTLYFSIKEAIYKAIDPFVQRYVGFHEVELDLVPVANGDIRVHLSLKNGEGPFDVDAWCEREDGLLLSTTRVRARRFESVRRDSNAELSSQTGVPVASDEHE